MRARLDGNRRDEGVVWTATVTCVDRLGASWGTSREEIGDPEGEQDEDRRERDDKDEYGTSKDGGRRGAFSRLGDSPKLLHRVFARADRVAYASFVVWIIGVRVVLHLVEQSVVVCVSSPTAVVRPD
jgi:hypothetical protein